MLLRRVAGSEQLLHHYDEPLVFLADYLRKVLASDYLLKDLVNDTDVEWGRMSGERPFFEKEERSADPDDPYTFASVRKTLTELVGTLQERETQVP